MGWRGQGLKAGEQLGTAGGVGLRGAMVACTRMGDVETEGKGQNLESHEVEG